MLRRVDAASPFTSTLTSAKMTLRSASLCGLESGRGPRRPARGKRRRRAASRRTVQGRNVDEIVEEISAQMAAVLAALTTRQCARVDSLREVTDQQCAAGCGDNLALAVRDDAFGEAHP